MARVFRRRRAARRTAGLWLLLLAAVPGIAVQLPAGAASRHTLSGTSGGPPLVVSRPWPRGWYGARQPFAAGADGAALTQVWADDFDRLSYRWTRYKGRPGGDPAGWWEPSQVTVQGGNLVLTGQVEARGRGGDPTRRWVSGGVKLEHDLPPLRYGRADVRLRAEPGPWALAVLLWPADNGWPPEIDFVEDNGGDRSLVTATLHTGTPQARRAVRATTRVDFTQWHTWSVAWSPGKVVYSVDGVPWATMTDPGVPSQGLRLVVQLQAWPCHHGWYEVCPGPASPPVHVYVDRVAVWTR